MAEAEILFAHVDQMNANIPASVDQKNFVFEMGLMGVLDVGKAGSAAAT